MLWLSFISRSRSTAPEGREHVGTLLSITRDPNAGINTAVKIHLNQKPHAQTKKSS
jgi:hypothetical protein